MEVHLPAYDELSIVDLPAYSSTHALNERVLLQQPIAHQGTSSDYQYETGHMLLKLGKRFSGMNMPCYGKNAVIEGSLTVKSFRHAEEVSVAVIGKVTTTLVDRGYPVSQDGPVVLYEQKILWSAGPGKALPTGPIEYPISFPIPTYARGQRTLLPPSSYLISSCMSAAVRYSIKVDMCRKGLRWHESIETPILYLPRSVPLSLRYIHAGFEDVEAKVDDNPEVQWRTVDVQPYGEAPASRAFIQLALPMPLSYPSGTHIPFTLGILTDDPIDPHVFLHNLSVTFIKRTGIAVNGYRTRSDRILKQGTVWKMEKTEEGLWTVSGSVCAGREGGEVSWSLPGTVDVKYCVEVAINAAERGLSCAFKHAEPVQITTHEEFALDDSRELPALELMHLELSTIH